MEKRLCNIFKTTNVTKLAKTILKSSYRILQIYLRAVEFFAIVLEKLRNYTFQKAYRSLSKHTNIQPFIQNMSSIGGSFFKIKIVDILGFKWIKYLGKDLSYLQNWCIGVNYCWNYGLSNLPLHFIEYHLDQHNNKHTKTAVNSTIHYFKRPQTKEIYGMFENFWPTHFNMRTL